MNGKLRKLLRDPKNYFLDMKALAPVWGVLGVAKKAKVIAKSQVKSKVIASNQAKANVIANNQAKAKLEIKQSKVEPVESSAHVIAGWELFDLIGDNWVNGSEKKIVVLFGFNPWKRDFVSEYLADYRTAYVRGNTAENKVLAALVNKSVAALVVWGMYSKIDVKNFSKNLALPVWRMEDGFLRSTTLGSVHSRPLSLVLDKSGIYFDSTRSSDLEKILSDESNLVDQELMVRAKNCIDLITTLRISKYNDNSAMSTLLARSSSYSILVIGQVEDDASIVFGCNREISNNDVVRQARKDFPDAKISFRAHPDVLHGHRKQKSNPAEIASLCEISDPNQSISDALDSVDHVYTITSLSGFEALIRGKKVTTLGLPFYAGWGEADTRQDAPRRKTTRSALEIFAASYITYPLYNVGFRGPKAQVEHAVLSLYLQNVGCSDVVAGDLASCFSSSEINIELCRTLRSLVLESAIAARLFLSCHKVPSFPALVKSIIAGESLTASLVQLCHDNPDYPGVFENALLSAKNERSLDLLTSLVVIKSETIPVSSAAAYVRALLLSGNINDAERFVYEKIEQTSTDDPESLVVLVTLFGGIHIEQGRFGRKPVLSIAFMESLDSWVPLFAHHLTGPVLLARVMEYLAHQRQWNVTYNLCEKILSNVDRSTELSKWLALQGVMIKALTARFKRPEPKLQQQFEYARRIFNRMEAEVLSKYSTLPIPFSVLVDLAESQIALASPGDKLIYSERAQAMVAKRGKVNKAEHRRLKGLISRNYAYFTRTGRYADALRILARFKTTLMHEYYVSQAASAHMVTRNYSIAEHLLKVLISKYNKPAYTKRLAVLMERQGKLSVAIAMLEKLSRATSSGVLVTSWKEQDDIKDDLDRLYFLRKSDEILKSVPQPKLPKGVVFVTSAGCLNSISMMVPILRELKKRGYAVVQVDEGMLPNEPTGLDWIDQHAGVVPRTLPPDVDFQLGLQNEWVVDWAGRKVIAQGINFYQGLFETMSMRLRAFNFDINDRGPLIALKRCLVASDRALSVCKAIKKTVMDRGMPVRFINAASHGAPYSIYRSFALAESKNYDVGFIHIGQAYENYYSNLTGKLASTVCLDNMTKHPNYRMPFLARPNLFENWLSAGDQYLKNKDSIERLLTMNRVGRNSGPNAVEQRLIELRAEGRKIIGVYGKILCDMAVPYDGGAAHTDIVDWLRHTVSVASKTKNVFVLKPHPHELRHEIARDLNEFWLDLIDRSALPDNVIALPHNGFNNQDLIPLLDLAVLWNGTSSLELLAQGVPVMMASHFGKLDYPIDMIYPTSRSHYEDILCASSWGKPSHETMVRGALLLQYMGTEEVSVPFKYSYRPVTNEPVGVPYWHDDAIDVLIASGDPHISKLVDKIF